MKKIKNLRLDFLTVFPNILDSYWQESLFRRAIKTGLLKIKFHSLRDYSLERHRKVDDRPYGGGPGMVLQIEPIYRALKKISLRGKKVRVVLLSARGKKFTASDSVRLAKYDQLIFVCGRYEGVDERVAKHLADEEISMGDFILSGGELPAMAIAEAVARQLPGFLGKSESLEEINGSFPTYTRPPVFKPEKNSRKAWKVPKVLLSGNHKDIDLWREHA